MRRNILTVFFFILTATFAAHVQKPFSVEDFNEKPSAAARENYFDLMGKIFSEAVDDKTKQSAIFSRSIELRKLTESAENTLYEAPVKVESAHGWWFRAADARHHETRRRARIETQKCDRRNANLPRGGWR